jgi:hypothetical protein
MGQNVMPENNSIMHLLATSVVSKAAFIGGARRERAPPLVQFAE